MKAVRSDRDLKWRMVGENGDWSIEVGVDQLDQIDHLLTAKITASVSWTKRVQRDQAHRIILDRVVDEVAASREISICRKGGAQISSVVLIAGQHINRRVRSFENSHRLRILIAPSVIDDIAGVNDHVGRRIECVDIRNG